jgi:retinol dehydrogenase-12
MSLEGKTVVVTGATAGIGLVTARRLAEQGASVSIVARNPERIARALSLLREKGPRGTHRAFTADLSLLADVARVSGELLAAHPRIDVLVNNAGAYFADRAETAEGKERTWALNHLGYFGITCRLMPALRAAPGARVVTVASDAHRSARLDLDDPEGKRSFNGWFAYANSKLMNILFSRELARRVGPGGPSTYSLHPGFVASEFGHNNPGLMGTLLRWSQVFAIDVERGSDTSVFVASDPSAAGTTGAYWSKQRVARPRKAALDDAAAARLWALSAELTGVDVA